LARKLLFNFEDAMKRLDKITEELSREGVELEKALALYEEGVKLARACNAKLEDTERKIKMLQISASGELVEEDFAANEA
ncbi:MAG: exodeoxyribonuclease VII small subunit, partial [Ruminococcaceae bacterium]|nr:exodeoxyribonuclease VII small subunit [Oscillospiraceae bacterium]